MKQNFGNVHLFVCISDSYGHHDKSMSIINYISFNACWTTTPSTPHLPPPSHHYDSFLCFFKSLGKYISKWSKILEMFLCMLNQYPFRPPCPLQRLIIIIDFCVFVNLLENTKASEVKFWKCVSFCVHQWQVWSTHFCYILHFFPWKRWIFFCFVVYLY